MLFVLAKFDVRAGNQVVWTSEPVEAYSTLPGIEFKIIPSGLHDRRSETIYFVCGSWQGIARYESRINGPPGSRDDAQMYSLAALAPLTNGFPWSQESFLKRQLSKFLDSGCNLSVLPTSPYNRPDPRAHPVLASSSFLKAYGPMVFELWKAGLSRSRVILASIPDQSIRAMSQFTYMAAQIASIPSDVAHLLPCQKLPIQCLYNVTISDLQRLQTSESYWATTTDGLLLTPSRDACDSFADQHALHDNTAGSPGRTIFPTWRDRHRFVLLVESLGLEDIPYSSGILENVVDATANGLLWWASAGESAMINRDESASLMGSPSPTMPMAESTSDGVALIGQFQQYTRQLVRVFSKIADDDDYAIRIRVQDIAAMGLDPLAKSDHNFLQRFSLAWWDRPVVFVGLCCCCR